jgi:membrane protein
MASGAAASAGLRRRRRPAWLRPWRWARVQLRSVSRSLQRWPWLETARTLRDRFKEDRLGQTAGSLTFTTLIALVPLLTVMLALFSVFPYFGQFKLALEQYFLQNLVPDSIAKPVLASLTQFAGKANRLGAWGLGGLMATALALMLTIDRALNGIWRVRRARPLAQRVLVYWAALTLGPLLLGGSLTLTSYALSASKGLVSAVPAVWALVIDVLQFVLLAMSATGIFRYVPNTHVAWRHALAGGLFVAAAFEVAKVMLGWYLSAMPSYGSVYGTFASVPILLLWTYLVWLVVLFGAVIAAYAPTLSLGVASRPVQAGWRFDLALRVLAALQAARRQPPHGLTLNQLAARLRVDPLQIDPLLTWMVSQGWVGRLDDDEAQRHVLLADPDTTAAWPMVDVWLLADGPSTAAARSALGVRGLRLADLLG